ncbi:putative dehalogenase hydrolase-like protein [Rhizobium phage RHph_I1_18]|nr:putative dehalogenase hydrolase-like protein [Rhizobium phage RHph_I1_18]
MVEQPSVKIKHISLDVWNTLVKANPEYANARTKYLADRFRLDEEFVRQTYTKTKTWIDNFSEKTGVAPSVEGNVLMLMNNLNVFTDPYEIISEFRLAFAENQPIVIPEALEFVKLMRKNKITLSIGSNSNFISGNLINPWLDKTFGGFQFHISSDEAGVAKPSSSFFARVWRQSPAMSKDQIMHIGDNPMCDIFGAATFGFANGYISKPSDFNDIAKVILK